MHDPTATTRPSPSVARWVLAGCALLLFVLSLARLHGFSLPAWHDKIDGSPAPEVLLGKAPRIRSDDWAVSLPLIFSQSAQAQPFAPTSDLVGYGDVDMRVGSPVPVRGWIALFRPQLWGYFAGRDVGMAWHWWFRILALFCAAFLAFLRLGGERAGLAAAAAAAFTAAPFFVFWSYNCEPLTAMAMLIFVSVVGVARAQRTASIVAWALLLAWSAGCFALSFLYPPYQVALAWAIAACVAAWGWRERAGLRVRARLPLRAVLTLAALGLAAACVAAFFLESREAIGLLSRTVYPGTRVSSGGEVSLLRLLQNYFTVPAGEAALNAFANVCDAGGFFYLSPLVGAAFVWDAIARRKRPDLGALVLLAVIVLFTAHAIFEFPAIVAKAMFLGRLPGWRSAPAVGWIDFALVAAFFASPLTLSRRAQWALTAAWGIGLLALGASVASQTGGKTAFLVLPVGVGFAACGFFVLRRRVSAVIVLAAVTIALTSWFNPVVRGGADYLESNAFSRKVLEIDRATGTRSRWIVFEQPSLANLFRAIGVRAVNGVHFYPQRELWARLGLLERSPDVWNRYAHVAFELASRPDEARLQLKNLDAVVVRIHPDHPAFARLEVDYLVWVGADPRALDGIRSLQRIASIGDKHIFRVLRPDPW